MSSFSLRRRFRPYKHGRAHSMLGANFFQRQIKNVGSFVTRAVVDKINPPKAPSPAPSGLPDVGGGTGISTPVLIGGGLAAALVLVMLLGGKKSPAAA